MKKRAKKPKRYQDMNLKELRAATAEFDQEFIAESAKPLTPTQRAQWLRAKRKRSRTKLIFISVERDLLARCDRLGKKKRVSRANLIARGLRAVLLEEKAS